MCVIWGTSGLDLHPGGVWYLGVAHVARPLMCVAACSGSSAGAARAYIC